MCLNQIYHLTSTLRITKAILNMIITVQPLRGSRRINHTTPSPLRPPPPRPIHNHRAQPHHQKQRTYTATHNIKIITESSETIPEGALRLGDVLDEGEQLDDADEGGDEDGDGGQDDGVVEDGDGVAREGLVGVQGHHQGAVGRVEHAHAG